MNSCLIVYYTRSGVTAQVANQLAQLCDADVEQIKDVRSRTGIGGYLRSAWEALRQVPATIAPPRHRVSDYQLVVLGTPVWAGRTSAPMRSYILQHRGQFRHLGLFCTMGGSGGPGVLAAMAALSNKDPVATLCLRQRDVLCGSCEPALHEFASKLLRLQAGDGAAPAAGPLPRPI